MRVGVSEAMLLTAAGTNPGLLRSPGRAVARREAEVRQSSKAEHVTYSSPGRSVFGVRGRLILLAFTAFAVGCGTDSDGSDPSTERKGDAAEGSIRAAETHVGRWRVAASVEPRQIGPLVFSVASLRATHRDAGDLRPPFMRGELGFRNTGDVPVALEKIDNSAFSEDEIAGDQLLLAEGQCGYEVLRERVNPGVCTLALLPPTRIKADDGKTLPFAVFTGLRGMDPLKPGRYEFTRRVSFTVRHSAEAPAKHAGKSTLVLEISQKRL
jgi:hypothetical protein